MPRVHFRLTVTHHGAIEREFRRPYERPITRSIGRRNLEASDDAQDAQESKLFGEGRDELRPMGMRMLTVIQRISSNLV